MIRPFRAVTMLALIIFGWSSGVCAELEYSLVNGADEVPILVVESGKSDGDVIVFVHGMSQSHLSWIPQFESELAEHYRLIAFDLRGHGGSGKPWKPKDYSASRGVWAQDLNAVFKQKNIKSATLVAWSFGGYIAMSYIREFGDERLNGLVLSGTLAGLIDIPRSSLPAPSKEALEGSSQRSSLNLLDNISGYSSMPGNFTFRPMSERFRQIADATALMQPAYVRRAMTDLPLVNTDMLDRLALPVLLSIGDKDRGITSEAVAELVAALDDAQLSEYPDVGHFPSYEKSDRFNCELIKFVASKELDRTCESLQVKEAKATPNLPPCKDLPYCGFQRPEDISPIPNTDWAIVSDGSVYDLPLRLIKASTPSVVNEVMHQRLDIQETVSECGQITKPMDADSKTQIVKEFRGHAAGIVNGEPTFAVINATAPPTIEIYSVNVNDALPSLMLKQCVPIPKHLNLNDVALGEDGAIYASHMFNPIDGPKDIEKLMGQFKAKLVTGIAMVWRKEKGWQSIPGSDLSFPNGIAISDNGRILAVSGTYSQSVKLIDLDTQKILSLELPIQPDNITPLMDGGFMMVGHSGTPLTGIADCRPPEARPCGFPFLVLEIDKSHTIKVIYQHDGQQYPGASVVVPWSDNRLLLGTAFGNRLTIVGRE